MEDSRRNEGGRKENTVEKIPVIVKTERKENGKKQPVSLVLPCGHFFRIDRVLHYAVSPVEYEGLRFTVMIGGEEKYIYRSGDNWYIFADRKGGNQ